MATKVQTEEPLVEHSPTANLETDLALEFLRVVEEAAIASGKTMGQGDRKHADQVATEAMRSRHGLGTDGRNHRHRRR